MLTPFAELGVRFLWGCSRVSLGPLCWTERRQGTGTLPEEGGLLHRRPQAPLFQLRFHSPMNLASNPALPLPSRVASLPPRLFGERRKN